MHFGVFIKQGVTHNGLIVDGGFFASVFSCMHYFAVLCLLLYYFSLFDSIDWHFLPSASRTGDVRVIESGIFLGFRLCYN